MQLPEPKGSPQDSARSASLGATPSSPPVPPQNAPPPPTQPPGPGGGIDVRVSKRLLWVSDAVYPLHNIARVHTFTVRPKRKEAIVRFLKMLLVAVALATLGAFLLRGIVTLLWLIAIGLLIHAFVEMLSVLRSDSHYVLAVETSGPSIAVVTSTDRRHLDQLVARIARAIENPDDEFHVRVDTISFSPKNYYFGDNVNMYGGSGNVGVASS